MSNRTVAPDKRKEIKPPPYNAEVPHPSDPCIEMDGLRQVAYVETGRPGVWAERTNAVYLTLRRVEGATDGLRHIPNGDQVLVQQLTFLIRDCIKVAGQLTLSTLLSEDIERQSHQGGK